MADDSQPKKPTSGRRGAKKKPVTIDLPADAVTEQAVDATADKPEPKTTNKATPAEVPPESSASATSAAQPTSAPPEDEPPASSADEHPAPAQEKRGSVLPALMGAVIGGILAIGGTVGLAKLGALPGLGQPEAWKSADKVLTDRLNGLQTRAETIDADLATTKKGLDAARVKIDTATNAASDLAVVKSTLAALQKDLSGLQAAVSGGAAGGDAALASLRNDLEKLAERTDTALANANRTVPTASTGDVPAGLIGRLDTLDRQVAALTSVKPTAADTAEIAGLKTRLDAVDAAVATLKTKIASLSQPSGNAAQAAAQAVTIAALGRVVVSGRPYVTELAAARQLAGDQAKLAPLDANAKTGIATPSALIAEFGPVARAILEKTGTNENDGFLGRLMSNARSIVHVRPVGMREGTTPAAIVARIEAHLTDGDLSAAHGEWASLPETGKAISKDWAERLGARIEAVEIINTLTQAALSALSSNSN